MTTTELSISVIVCNTILIRKHEKIKLTNKNRLFDSMGSHHMEVAACFKQGS